MFDFFVLNLVPFVRGWFAKSNKQISLRRKKRYFLQKMELVFRCYLIWSLTFRSLRAFCIRKYGVTISNVPILNYTGLWCFHGRMYDSWFLSSFLYAESKILLIFSNQIKFLRYNYTSSITPLFSCWIKQIMLHLGLIYLQKAHIVP